MSPVLHVIYVNYSPIPVEPSTELGLFADDIGLIGLCQIYYRRHTKLRSHYKIIC